MTTPALIRYSVGFALAAVFIVALIVRAHTVFGVGLFLLLVWNMGWVVSDVRKRRAGRS